MAAEVAQTNVSCYAIDLFVFCLCHTQANDQTRRTAMLNFAVPDTPYAVWHHCACCGLKYTKCVRVVSAWPKNWLPYSLHVELLAVTTAYEPDMRMCDWFRPGTEPCHWAVFRLHVHCTLPVHLTGCILGR